MNTENNVKTAPEQESELEDFLSRLNNQNEHLGRLSSRLGRLKDRLDGPVPTCVEEAETPMGGDGILNRIGEALSENMRYINQIDDLVQRVERVA